MSLIIKKYRLSRPVNQEEIKNLLRNDGKKIKVISGKYLTVKDFLIYRIYVKDNHLTLRVLPPLWWHFVLIAVPVAGMIVSYAFDDFFGRHYTWGVIYAFTAIFWIIFSFPLIFKKRIMKFRKFLESNLFNLK